MSGRLAPGFLVAVPELADDNFRQTVILLLQQGEEGALGIVVNRETTLPLKDLCQDHKLEYGGDPDKRVRLGGPVQPEQGLVVYGAEYEDPEGRPVVDDLHVSASTGTLGRLCRLPGGRFHCFSGYAGWGPGQLEEEIERGSWIVIPANTRLVFEVEPEQMWSRALEEAGIDPGAIVPGDNDA